MDKDLEEFSQGCEDAKNGIAHNDTKSESYTMGYAYQYELMQQQSQGFN